MTQPKICFIGGSGRSGTTVLRRIFAGHSKVGSIPEFRITVDPGGLTDFYLTMKHQWSPWLVEHRIRELEHTLLSARRSNPVARYYRYGLKKAGLACRGFKLEKKYTDISIEKYCGNYRGLVDQLIRNLTHFRYRGSWTGMPLGSENHISFHPPWLEETLALTLGNFYREVIRCVCIGENKTHFVEDNTWNILHFRELLKLMPEGKLVHIYRDPRDVVASFTRQWWAPRDPVEAARFYAAIMERWHTVKKDLPEDSYHEISLEKLVANPEKVLRKVVRFWDLEWSDNLLSLPLDRANSGRWEKDLPYELRQEILRILTPFMKHYGYE